MVEYAGSSLYLKFGTVVLSSDFRNFTEDEEVDLVDASAGSDAYKPKIVTQTDGNASVELVDQTGGTVLWAAVAKGTEGTLEWGPEGTVTGKPRHHVVAIVSKRSREVPYDNIVVLNVDFAFNSVVTDTLY